MGSCNFITAEFGDSAQDAFEKAVRQAQHENGHGGYTGTIAEKGSDGFVMIKKSDNVETGNLIEELFADDDPRISSKWGPAGCIDEGDGKFIFFGWASS